MKNRISTLTKALIVITSTLGVILSFVNATNDGYSHWSKRLLYFTGQSNIWLGFFLAVLLALMLSGKLDNEALKARLYAVRFVLTVSISITAIIFCVVLAPFSHREGYNAWTLSSFLTHVITPALAIFDFFFDKYRISLTKRHLFASLIPLFAYLLFVSILILLKVDFGRGDPYPYIFLNYYSPAGFFGFSDQMPYIFGSFYWFLIILSLVFGLGRLYQRITDRLIGKQREKSASNSEKEEP